MRRFAAVALREIAERRFVLVAAAFAATIPLLVPLVPKVPADEAIAARSIAALVLAFTFGIGGSLLVGASVVGRELAERRLSFHFSRPIPGPVIWCGKLVGGLALVLLAEAIVVLPTAAVIRGIPTFGDAVTDPEFLRGLLLAPVPLFLLAWMSSVALRSRSLWLVVDAVLAVALPATLFLVGRRFILYGGRIDDTNRVILIVLGVFLAAALAGTLAQVVVGRTDGRRGHGAQSLTFWGVLWAATALGAAWAERTIDPGVSRLVQAWAEPAGPGGDWVTVQGSVLEHGATSAFYLLDLNSGRSLHVTPGWETTVSRDGSRAIRLRIASLRPDCGVAVEAIELKSGRSVTLDLAEWPQGTDLTSDGRRLAVVSGGICRVVELPSLRLLASARVPSSGWIYVPRFLSPDTVRLHPFRNYRHAPARVIENPVAAELNVETRSVTALCAYPVASIPVRSPEIGGVDHGPLYQIVPSKDLSRVLVMGLVTARGTRLLDAASGRVLAALDDPGTEARPVGSFAADGRAVLVARVDGGERLVLFSPEGTRLSEIALPAGMSRVRLGGEPGKGLLSIGVERKGGGDAWEWHVANLDTGELRPLGAEALHRPWWSGELRFVPPGSPASRLAFDADRRLVLYDPATGAQTPITRGEPRGK
jgi:hypothetical protein